MKFKAKRETRISNNTKYDTKEREREREMDQVNSITYTVK